MTTRNENKNTETFERRVRQMYADYYRHAKNNDRPEQLMCKCGEYGVTMSECFDMFVKYNDEMRNFYADTDTVEMLMKCNH